MFDDKEEIENKIRNKNGDEKLLWQNLWGKIPPARYDMFRGYDDFRPNYMMDGGFNFEYGGFGPSIGYGSFEMETKAGMTTTEAN